MTHKLYKLPYSFDSLEPHIDAKTMEIHYTKHHQTYLDNFLKTIEPYKELQNMSAEDILKNLNNLKVGKDDKEKIKNYGGGFVNHDIYWSIMGPKKKLDQKLIEEITDNFKSLTDFKQKFSEIAKKHFGSGWVWLVRDKNNDLQIYSLPNQDSPYTLGDEPILALDVWEHAYYLKYQNKRTDYIDNWWKIVKLI